MLTSLGKYLLSLVVVLSLLPHVVLADQQQLYKESIEELALEIKLLSRNLNANRALLKSERDNLSTLEQEIISFDKKIAETSKGIELQKQRNSELDAQLQELQRSQAGDRQALMKLIRERYMRGESNYLKMLLNQESPYAVGRLANYLDYFTTAQKVKFDGLRQQALKKQALLSQQDLNLTEMQGHYEKNRTQQQALDLAKEARRESVNKLESKVVKTEVKLDQLQQDRQRLNHLLQKIAEQAERMRKLEQQRIEALRETAPIAGIPSRPVVRPLVKGGFVKQRGRLSYPVSGSAEFKFGKRIAESGMRAQGTLIATKGSVDVKSIFRGRVLFSDYLKGYGLLLIIDHGDDHISLYGHNEVLYKQVGDQVETNEVVAKTGVSGGLKTHGLYFEIRNTATPVDPGIWCR